MTTTKAPGDGLPAQLPDENFHDYMSRLYREQGYGGATAALTSKPGSQPLYAQFWAIPEGTGLGPLHRHPIRHHQLLTTRNNAEHHCCRSPRQGPRAAHHPIRPRDHQFSLGVSIYAGGEQRTEWLVCSIWGKRGETLRNYCSKGQQVTISGKLFHDTWQGKDGEVNDFCVDVADFSLPPREQPQQQAAPAAVTADIPF